MEFADDFFCSSVKSVHIMCVIGLKAQWHTIKPKVWASCVYLTEEPFLGPNEKQDR